jgi:hypothetical protein
MTNLQIEQAKQYISGSVSRIHATNPMVIHGEIAAPAMLVSDTSPVVLHKPTDGGRRTV